MTELKGTRAEAFIRNPPAGITGVLCHGTDEGLIAERAETIVRAVAGSLEDPFKVIKLDDDTLQADPARLADEADSLPLSGGRAVIWVRSGGPGLKRAFEIFSPTGAEVNLIVAEAGNLRKGDKLRTLFETSECLVALASYPDDEKALRTVVKATLAEANVTLGEEAMATLLARLGEDRQLTRSELEKLCLYGLDTPTLTVEDIEAVCGEASALMLDSFLDGVFCGDLAVTDAHYWRLTETGISPAGLVTSGTNHASMLLRLHAQLGPGRSAQNIVERARPPIFFKRRNAIVRQLAIWDASALQAAMLALEEAEYRTRDLPAIADQLVNRTFLSLARQARAMRRRAA